MKILTIVIPSYNVEKTLPDTLRSVCIEPIREQLDILVVDDGSTDGTAALADDFARQYPDIVRVIHKPNGGHGSAVNTGIEAAQGRYLKVVDGDDRLEAAGLLALVECLGRTDADLVAADYRKVPTDGSTAQDMRFEGVEPGRVYRFDEIPAASHVYFGIHSLTIRTEILQSHDIRLQEHTFYVDVEFGLLPIPYVGTVEFLGQTVYLYMVGRAEQSIAAGNFVRRYADHERVVRRMTEFAGTCETDMAHHGYMDSVLCKVYFTQYMLAAFYDGDIPRGKTRAREFDSWLHENNPRLYARMGTSLYIRVLRATGFHFLPRGRALKTAVRRVYSLFKPLTHRRRRFTY